MKHLFGGKPGAAPGPHVSVTSEPNWATNSVFGWLYCIIWFIYEMIQHDNKIQLLKLIMIF